MPTGPQADRQPSITAPTQESPLDNQIRCVTLGTNRVLVVGISCGKADVQGTRCNSGTAPAAVTECCIGHERRSSNLLAIVAHDSGVIGRATRRPAGPISEVRRPTSALHAGLRVGGERSIGSSGTTPAILHPLRNLDFPITRAPQVVAPFELCVGRMADAHARITMACPVS